MMKRCVRKSLLFFLLILLTPRLWSENKHLVDFETSFFKKSPYSRWMRDPFRGSPGFVKTGAGTTAWPKLTTVSKKEGKVPYAVLDGKKYREGEFVSQSRYVSAIGQNFVILTEGGFDYELAMTEAAIAASVDRGIASDPAGK